MNNVLFVSNPGPQCGVHQFGKATVAALTKSKWFNFIYLECSDLTGSAEYLDALQRCKPVAVIYNWHPQTMRWLSEHLLDEVNRLLPSLKHASIVHDEPPPFRQLCAIIHCDPTFHERGRHFKVGRLLLPHTPKGEARDNIIGSFGFGAGHKGFSRLVEKVNSEFETATIRLHIPYGLYGDADGQQARKVVEDCLQRAKQGVVIQASHHFMEPYELLDWLAGNTINCFFYDRLEGRGISSALDFAIAARRPIAITNSCMFRHVVEATPTILIEQASLRQIIANGIKPLEPFYRTWTEENLVRGYEKVVNSMLRMNGYNLIANRVLTPLDRDQLKPVVDEMTSLAPEIMSRKIPDAVFQNAFIFQQARYMAKKTDSIMIIGGYEDPIGPALQKLGYDVKITDPQLDGKDMEAVWMESIKFGLQYDIVISCSVLEHIENDVEFVQQMYQILKPGGVALLTADYLENWVEGDSKPAGDVGRLYTSERLRYLTNRLPVGSLLDPATWGNQTPYFECQSVKYGFCSLAFRRTTTPDVVSSGFATNNAVFVRQQYLDFLDREPDSGGSSVWANALDSGLPRASLIETFMDSAEFRLKGKFIAQTYLGILTRDADHGGFREWLGAAGISREQIVQGFLDSGEFQANFGSSLTNGDFVERMYLNVLLRSPDPGGFNFWVGQLNSGQMTRVQVALSFLDSEEFQNLQSSQNEVNVSLLYFDMLRRDPDAGRFSAWVGALNSGVLLTSVIDAFLNSPEYQARF